MSLAYCTGFDGPHTIHFNSCRPLEKVKFVRSINRFAENGVCHSRQVHGTNLWPHALHMLKITRALTLFLRHEWKRHSSRPSWTFFNDSEYTVAVAHRYGIEKIVNVMLPPHVRTKPATTIRNSYNIGKYGRSKSSIVWTASIVL